MVIFFSVIHYTNRAINRKKEAEAAAAAEGKELPSIKEASFNEITSDK